MGKRSMRTASKKAKGRALQQEVAEMLSYSFGLTIMASPPTKPGNRNGAEYVPEPDGDILIRRMSQPGTDVLLKSQKSIEIVNSHFGCASEKSIVGFECKNDEALAKILAWPFGGAIISTQLYNIFKKARNEGCVLCVSANRKHPLLVVAAEWAVRLKKKENAMRACLMPKDENVGIESIYLIGLYPALLME
jgi:hypothetical protein